MHHRLRYAKPVPYSTGAVMDAVSTEDTEFLFQCMQHRRDILRSLRLLTDSHAAAAQADDINVTLGILARKESLLDELAQVLASLQRFHHDDPERRQWISPQRRQTCQALADEGDRLLNETVQLEQATLEEMQSQRDAVAAQLQNGTNSILAHNAYTAGEQLESSLDLSDL
ncbi:MAG: hypothetical protein R3C53_13530 [Pirellulaceae bacterium]